MKIPQANKSKLSNKEKANILKELKIVSRSFYLTLRVLPGKIFAPAGVAYLIARYIDNIVDDKSIPINYKKDHLYKIRESFTTNTINGNLDEFPICKTEKSDTKISTYKDLFDTLSSKDQNLVSKVLLEITDGMIFELKKFGEYSPNELKPLSTYSELDNYIYKIAGSVGEFFTGLILLHEQKLKLSNTDYLFEMGICFGKALQLTNIIRDFKTDLIEGKCYLPETSLANHKIHPPDLLHYSQDKISIALAELLQLATQYYSNASTYILFIPKSCPRLRLAALWPLLIGVETLQILASGRESHNSNRPIKVKRNWIYLMIMKSILVIHNDKLLKFIIERQIKKLKDKIGDI
tara:strand:+ start:150 stop:1202 length:1053 start_codon:yes stop_codon:yes gene_type:complete